MLEALSNFRDWPTQRPITRMTAKCILEFVRSRGISDVPNVVSFGCRAVQCWAAVFQLYEYEDQGWMWSTDLYEALTSAGYNVSKRYVRCLLEMCERCGQIYFNKFIQACAMTATHYDP